MRAPIAGLSLAAAAALVLTGCSSDDDSAVSGTTAPATVTVTESATESPASQSKTSAAEKPEFSVGIRAVGGAGANGSTWNFHVPKLSGGDGTPARTVFDDGIDAAVDRLTDGAKESDVPVTIGNGELTDGDGDVEKTRTVVDHPAAVSGALIVLTNTEGAAHPINQVATVVVETATGEELTLHGILTGEAALTELAALAQTADTSGRLADASLTPTEFAQWIALPEGLHLYVPVAHVMGDYVPVTIPWSQASELLTPEARSIFAA